MGGGGPSIPNPPAPPDPMQAAQANLMFYRGSLDAYIEKAPAMAETENKLRIKYMPAQRQLERQLAALDQKASVETGLQLERQYGGQRTLEGLRRSYEQSPAAFALNRGLGDQMTRQFEQLYGQSPYGSVPLNVAFAYTRPPVDYIGTIGTNIAQPKLEA